MRKRIERFYGGPHARPELLDLFTYGLPELHRESIREARFVASPGCFATSIELALLPFARAGLLRGNVEVVGITGSSGAGVTPSPTTHHPTRSVNLRTYRPLNAPTRARKSKPRCARPARASSGSTSCPSRRRSRAASSRRRFFAFRRRYPPSGSSRSPRDTYAPEPFVRTPRHRLPEVVAVAGSNYAEVGVVAAPEQGDTRLVTAFAALDNLVKGGAGQAVQNMNLMLGLPETTALEDPGGYP